MAMNSLEHLARLLLSKKFVRELEKVGRLVDSKKPLERWDYAPQQLERILREEVLTSLYPLPLTLAELCDAFVGEVLFSRHKDGIDVDSYCRSLEWKFEGWEDGGGVRPRESAPFPVASISGRLKFTVAGEILYGDGNDEDGEAVILWGTGPSSAEPLAGSHERGESASEVLYAELGGLYSEQAIEQRSTEIAPVIRSIFASAVLSGNGSVKRRGQLPELGADVSRKALRPHLRFAMQSLMIYMAFNPYATKALPGLAGRLPIAMAMLSEADVQARAAVALSLCFSGIEAALGGDGQDITKTLAQNVAVLLEPDRLRRPDAERAVKRLYGVRSKFIHGARLEHEPAAVNDCRLLAAAVVQALLERRDFERRMGKEGSDYLAELKHDFATGQSFVGPKAQPAVQRLWRGNSATSGESERE